MIAQQEEEATRELEEKEERDDEEELARKIKYSCQKTIEKIIKERNPSIKVVKIGSFTFYEKIYD